MKILGLTIGELSSAAVMVDGAIVSACSEERFTRVKNDERYPTRAIAYCLQAAGLRGDQLDLVSIAGLSLSVDHWLTRTYSTFTMADQIRAQHEYWYPRFYGGSARSWLTVFHDKLDLEQFPGAFGNLAGRDDADEDLWPLLRHDLEAAIRAQLDAPAVEIAYTEHHSCHAAYAYFGSPFRDEPVLVLTADAFGDGLSATISVADHGVIRRIHEVPHSEFRLARLYRYITLLLGMKPNEHEYKVMGLAAYAKPDMLQGPLDVFRKTMYVNGLGFAWHEYPPDMYFYFRERLEGFRFDAIAGALQRYLEDILAEWVANAVRHTGISRVVFSGGIAMNVKAHKVLHELDVVSDLFVCGAGSDESLAIGTCYHSAATRAGDGGGVAARPHGAYLGPAYDSTEALSWVRRLDLASRYHVVEHATADDVAQCLADGLVVGRCVGRMEFGARALGNRSILADPRRKSMVDTINHKIKNRDFWMPFAPSILAERADDYVVNPKGIRSPWMTIGFAATPLGISELPAALHSADSTLRPHFVDSAQNEKYHELLRAFERITGVGGVLNTSFNLHGEPIVCSLDDALRVFEASEIDVLALDGVVIRKRDRDA